MMRRTCARAAGVSGASIFVPPARVDLEQWCQWTGNKWDKVQSVVGSSFRIPARNENAYTMAANAALRTIIDYDVDPQSIGFLGLGTESSTDNSAGSVIVRGMLDKALQEMGMPRLSRQCEVPEYKHACLGGIYALKNACRFAETDGRGRKALVMSSDIAEYAPGSSGEQTQGAGACAMLVEATPKMFELDLTNSGSASAYRGPDFRKPFKRHFMPEYQAATGGSPGTKVGDFPVFSGPYSTIAYLDEVTQAVEAMIDRLDTRPSELYESVEALFFHRPYHMMPVQAMSFLYARALARSSSTANRDRFEAVCAKAKIDPIATRQELDISPDLFGEIEEGRIPTDAFPLLNKAAKVVRSDKGFTELLSQKMSLGSKTMANLGNLYTAALPAWITAGFDEAYQAKRDLRTGGLKPPMVIVGYGSGDASEAIPVRPVAGWETAASKINVARSLGNAVTLSEEQYRSMHNAASAVDMEIDFLDAARKEQFVIDHIGSTNNPTFQDIGIEYYAFRK